MILTAWKDFDTWSFPRNDLSTHSCCRTKGTGLAITGGASGRVRVRVLKFGGTKRNLRLRDMNCESRGRARASRLLISQITRQVKMMDTFPQTL